jgi:hypothetical protein
MARSKKPVASNDRLRPSKAARQLREALGLDEDDWQSFSRHARGGFADYEKANLMDEEDDPPLRLRDVPDEWLQDPEAIGYIFLRVVKQGKKTLAAPVARYLLQVCDPAPESPVPPGTGLAWLHLARAGLAPPIDPNRLVLRSLDESEEFFRGIVQDDLLPLCRLILEGQGTIRAWDLHAIFAAIQRARMDALAPFRLFDDLMASDGITASLKREFCRGVLEWPPEIRRLREHREATRVFLLANLDRLLEIPRAWADIGDRGIGWRFPMLKRHAVYALVESAGEPLRDVIDEFLLKSYHSQASSEAVSLGVLDLIGLHAEELGPEVVRQFLAKAITEGYAPVRQAAYRVGAERFGLEFARPALKDEAGRVRNWAAKVLTTKKVRPARKAAAKRRARSAAQEPAQDHDGTPTEGP